MTAKQLQIGDVVKIAPKYRQGIGMVHDEFTGRLMVVVEFGRTGWDVGLVPLVDHRQGLLDQPYATLWMHERRLLFTGTVPCEIQYGPEPPLDFIPPDLVLTYPSAARQQ